MDNEDALTNTGDGRNDAAVDTPGWINPYNNRCYEYLHKGWCLNGAAVVGQEWTLGAKYRYPELNCVICGKLPWNLIVLNTPTGSSNVNGWTFAEGMNGLSNLNGGSNCFSSNDLDNPWWSA